MDSGGQVKRPYRSLRREEQAEQTRLRIAAAARELFVRDGYARTSVRAIAGVAGVAEPTVYAVYGTKSAILMAVYDQLDIEAGVMELRAELQAAAAHPGRQLDLIVEFDRHLFERAADVFAAAQQAGDADPMLAALLREGRERGRRGRMPVVTAWAEAGALKPGLDVTRAVDIFLGLCGHALYLELVEEDGWTVDEWERWLRATLRAALFGDSSTVASSGG